MTTHEKSLFFDSAGSYLQTLANTRIPAFARAVDPFQNHPWVFSASMAVAITASQAPFLVFEETPDEVSKRIRARQRPRYGSARRALERRLSRPSHKRLAFKGAEPNFNHPTYDLLRRPNPYQTGSQLFTLTYIWMSFRGEAFWVKTMKDGSSPGPGVTPEVLWPLSPDLFRPIFSEGEFGELAGWLVRIPSHMSDAHTMAFPVEDVIQFKYPNPDNIVRGMSRISALAGAVEMDMLISTHNRRLLEGGGVPKGILFNDSDIDPAEEKRMLREWKQKFDNPDAENKTAILSGGFKYTPLSISPKDMDHLEARKWDREEILAAMGVPPSTLGVTDFINYATQLGQDKNFLDKNIIPLWKMMEESIDENLFFMEPDSTFGAYDLSGVEALRSGMLEKVTAASQMTAMNLHMPPDIAFGLVDLEVPEYPLSDEALVSPMLVPVSDLKDLDFGIGAPIEEPETEIDDEQEETEEDETGGDPDAEGGDSGDPASDPTGAVEEPSDDASGKAAGRGCKAHRGSRGAGKPPTARRLSLKAKANRWREFVVIEIALENDFKKRYRSWIGAEKRSTLTAFDAALNAKARLKASFADFQAIIPDLLESQNKLKKKVRPTYTVALNETFDFTLDDVGGVPLIEIDDPQIQEFFNAREQRFIDATPVTVQKNIDRAIQKGLQAGETIAQIRLRIAQVYDISASSAKALSVARTEVAAFMNGVRNEMFVGQGFTEHDWITAGDENVREHHITYGNAGPQEMGFDYLTLTGDIGGDLTFPGDPACTEAAEVINCRCLMIPA